MMAAPGLLNLDTDGRNEYRRVCGHHPDNWTPTTLNQPSLTTYWLYPNSSVPVTYQYCVNIQGANPVLQCSLPANATFNVTGPTAQITPFQSANDTSCR